MNWTPHAAVWSKRATRATGQGDVKALKGEYAGRHRLRVGEWRVILRLYHDRGTVLVEHVVPRGSAYD